MDTQVQRPRICVVMATYNNAGTLIDVLRGVKIVHRGDVIVVNDGSTDSTAELLKEEGDIHIVTIAINKGKGNALRAGFQLARQLGHSHAITIDSDGQHDPVDIPKITQMIFDRPEAMVMGARDMGKREVPGRSSFGNRFSNFWFKVETGITLPDTQTGFRGWPLIPLAAIRTTSDRFGYEVESIVKLAWRGIPFEVVPVSVRYEFPKRVSHFKPFLDFTRISILNTWLVTLALLWYWPRKLLFKGGLKKLLRSELVRPGDTDGVRAASIGFGLFMGIVPIWGFQLAVGIPLAILFKLNRVLFFIAANISIPPMIPFILYASFLTGALFMDGSAVIPASVKGGLTFEDVRQDVVQYLIGSCVLATIAGLAGTAITYVLLRSIHHARS